MNAFKYAYPLVLIAGQAWGDSVPVANDPNHKVSSLEIVCASGVTARLERGALVGTIQEEALALDFTDFHLSTEDHQERLACLIDAVIKVPAGKRFCIRAGTVHGYAAMEGATGQIGFDYALAETHDFTTAERVAPSTTTTDIEVSSRIERPGATPCSNNDQYVHLSGSIWLDLFAHNGDDGSSIRITGQTSGSPYDAGWIWGWGKCN